MWAPSKAWNIGRVTDVFLLPGKKREEKEEEKEDGEVGLGERHSERKKKK